MHPLSYVGHVHYVVMFHYRYPGLLPYAATWQLDQLRDEFVQYQMMEDADIPDTVWQSALVAEDEQTDTRYYRMDVIWAHMKTMRDPDGALMFERLATVALLVLTLPHSNAEEERVFSLVTKNKTKFRPNLKLEGTLSSIVTLKLANTESCHTYDPTKEVLAAAKKATMTYNRAHSSKA